MNEDVKAGLRNIVIFVCIFLLTVIIGNSASGWMIILTTPLLCGGAAYYVSRDLKAVLGWGFIGLVAGICFYIAI